MIVARTIAPRARKSDSSPRLPPVVGGFAVFGGDVTARFWSLVDTLAHALPVPAGWLRWVCDRYDLALGVEPDQL